MPTAHDKTFITCLRCGGVNRVRSDRLGEASCGRCHAELTEALLRDRDNRLFRAERQLRRWRMLFVGWAVCTGAILLFQDAPTRFPAQVSSRGDLPSAAPRAAPSRGSSDEKPEAGAGRTTAAPPANGTVLHTGGLNGHGVLTLVNRTAQPAAVRLVAADAPGVARYELYVGENQSAGLSGVDPGEYTAWYCLGRDWDPEAKRFRQGRRVWKGRAPLAFRESVEHSEDELGRRFKTTRSAHLSFFLREASTADREVGPASVEEFDRLR